MSPICHFGRSPRHQKKGGAEGLEYEPKAQKEKGRNLDHSDEVEVHDGGEHLSPGIKDKIGTQNS